MCIRDRLGAILGPLHADLVYHDGRPAVSRDYRLITEPSTAGGLYVQGNTEHTHGLTSSLLSNIAIRSGEILASIDTTRTSQPPRRHVELSRP